MLMKKITSFLLFIMISLCFVCCSQTTRIYRVDGTSVFTEGSFEMYLESTTYDNENSQLFYNFVYYHLDYNDENIYFFVESIVFMYEDEKYGVSYPYENCNPNLNVNEYAYILVDGNIIDIDDYQFEVKTYTNLTVAVDLGSISELYPEMDMKTENILNNANCLEVVIDGYAVIFGDYQLLY